MLLIYHDGDPSWREGIVAKLDQDIHNDDQHLCVEFHMLSCSIVRNFDFLSFSNT